MIKMLRTWQARFLLAVLLTVIAGLSLGYTQLGVLAQIPTVNIPTVTGTPVNAYIIVRPSELGYANVRSGPSAVDYDIIGVLVERQQVPALGRSPGGQWIQVFYPGAPGGVAWIWADLVDVVGTLPIVEPPPTPTPRTTATIDPTLAAQFLVEQPPTRLPTFTEPPQLALVTYAVEDPVVTTTGLPVGLLIIGMAAIGLFGLLISFLRGR